jgi:hypothetical protein
MGLTKAQLEALNDSSFPNNNSGYITPAILRDYNDSVISNTVNQDVYSTDSASFDTRVDNLESWSSSLDTTYATDAQLNASSSVLQSNINTKLDTASFAIFSSSVNTQLEGLDSYTASVSTSVGLLQTFSSSQYKADSSSFDNRINQVVTGTGLVTTASFNAYTSSVSSSNSLTSASFDSRIDYIVGAYATTGSNTLLGIQTITGSVLLNGFFQGSNVYVTGSITASSYTGSVAGIGNVTTFSTSVDSRLTTNSQSVAAFSSSAYVAYAQLAVGNNYTANQTITGSAKGKVAALTVASSTASLDCSSGNFFTLTIPASTVTLINPINIQAGQTVGVLLRQNNPTGSVRWPSNCKFSSGSAAFTGSAIANAIDLVTFVSFDTTNLYMGGVKNLI